MIFTEHLKSTPDNINKLVTTNANHIVEFFERAAPVKKIKAKEIFNYGCNFDTNVTHLNNSAIELLKNRTSAPLSELLIYLQHKKAWEVISDEDITQEFISAKLHWLINDIKINGLGYPPQGFMKKDLFVCHPGTFRYLASFAQNHDEEFLIVFDPDNIFNERPLKLTEWINLCSNGFIRKQRYITIKTDSSDPGNQYSDMLEIHETQNHHDHNIINQDKFLKKLYSTKPKVFSDSKDSINEIKTKLRHPELYDFEVIHNKFYIPSTMNFEGVGIFLDKDLKINKDFSHILFYLDINDDVAYCNGITIFNNSTHNNQKLIPEIVDESTNEYLKHFLWCSKRSKIPDFIGGAL